jgi:phage terminase large subunit GpA-like protein
MGSLLNKELHRLFSPRLLKKPVDWALENCVLRDNVSELPGSLKVFPYAQEPLNALIDPTVNKITLCWGSQSSKTTTMYAGIAYLLSEFPKDTLWIMPSAENARNFSKGRWLPFINDCKPLLEQCPISAGTGRVDSDKITNMRQEFLSCTLTFAGAGSENNVKSAPVAYLVLDEIDEIDPDIRLAALERIKGRREYKIIQTSTPKDETGGVWEEFLYGDQRKYFMPCPHCEDSIQFEWRQKDKDGNTRYSIKFDEEAKLEDGYDFELVAASACYQCPSCDGEILDAHKNVMVKRGEWRSQNLNAPKNHRSYHLNSMYAPAMTFASLMVNWLQVSSSMHGLRKFVQGNLAEPWKDDWANQEQADANDLELDYERGDLRGEYRILGADTQTDSFWFVVRGFDRDGTSYLIDCGQVASFKELDSKFEQHSCHAAIIDCAGDRTAEIYDEVFRRRSRWFGSRGWKNLAGDQPYRLQMKDPFTGDTKGRGGRSKIRYLHVNKSLFEDELSRLRSRQISGFHTFTDTPSVYYDQLFATYWTKEADRSGHIKVVKKVKRSKGDHLWDCEILARALSKFIGIARIDRDSMPVIGSDKPAKKQDASSRNRSATSFW